MHNFNKVEKTYLKKIIDAHKLEDWKKMQFYSLVYSIFNRTIILKPSNSIGFEIDEDIESNNIEEQIKFKTSLIEGYLPLVNIANLFQYLESNHLINIIPYYHLEWISQGLDNFMVVHPQIDSVEGDEYMKIKSNEELKIRFPIFDPLTVNYLITNYSKIVCPSKELIDLVKNDFKTQEELQFEAQISLMEKQHACAMGKANEQITKATYSLWISWGALVSSAIFGIFSLCNETTIEKTQFEQILKKETMPAVIRTEITNDTIKANIVNWPEKKRPDVGRKNQNHQK